ncbi:hypothetical protein HYV86_03165 [Candidatus Woesearchaeota archaeon]|nr:hypothetical protein [Candidatus Woesearchaeota archaeon]
MKHTMKSIGAIAVGFITVFVLSVLTDLILETAGVFPPISEAGLFTTWMLVLALIYRTIYTIAGGYITARVAPTQPMRHAIILGSIGTVFAILGTIIGWDLSAHWYPIMLVILAIPSVWLGAKLHEIKNKKR